MVDEQHFAGSPSTIGQCDCRGRAVEVYIESDGRSNGEETRKDVVVGNGQSEKCISNFCWGSSYEPVNSSKLGDVCFDDVELLIDKGSGREHSSSTYKAYSSTQCLEGKHCKKSTKKPPKPPRPSKGLLLDVADQKLMQEITEFTMRRQVRIERMKSIKKMRASKACCWDGSTYALIITVFFFLIIIFQGGCHRNDIKKSPRVSPEPAVAISEIQLHKQFLMHENGGFNSSSTS